MCINHNSKKPSFLVCIRNFRSTNFITLIKTIFYINLIGRTEGIKL